jgi:hypothetical protein
MSLALVFLCLLLFIPPVDAYLQTCKDLWRLAIQRQKMACMANMVDTPRRVRQRISLRRCSMLTGGTPTHIVEHAALMQTTIAGPCACTMLFLLQECFPIFANVVYITGLERSLRPLLHCAAVWMEAQRLVGLHEAVLYDFT